MNNYQEVTFYATKEGKNQYYTRISNLENLKKGGVSEITVSTPNPLNINDGVMIPEGKDYHFIVLEVLESSIHSKRETPNCMKQKLKVAYVTKGKYGHATKYKGEELSILEYARATNVI